MSFERKGSVMFKSLSTSVILRGVLATIVGVIAIAWPGVTILALVVLFAVYAFMDAVVEGSRAFSSSAAGPVFGHLLLALVDVAAGVIALAWPDATALVLVFIIAIWAFLGGFLEIFAAFGAGEPAGMRALLVLSGLVSIALGVVLSSRPDIGAVSLALVYGLFSLVYGISQIVIGVQARQSGKTLNSLVGQTA
jgi:uncharacterized membrane protein HdeD (DUF308 family)